MTRSTGTLILLVSAAGLFTACRTQWVHPEASADRWAHDYSICRYGIAPANQVDPETGVRKPLPPSRPDWKRCLLSLGWSTRVGGSGSPVYSTPERPSSRRVTKTR